MSPVYGVPALICGGDVPARGARAVRGRIRRGEAVKPMRLFHWSTTYLTIVFVAVAVDVFI